MREKKKYFISYTTRTEKDVKRAKWTEWFFREIVGGETIMQEYNFHPGDNFKMKMNEALKKSDCVVCVLTHAYLGSTNCSEEWANAENIILIKFDDCNPTGLLKSSSYINLCGLDRNAARKKLITELADKTRHMEEPEFPIFSKEPEYSDAPGFPMNNLPTRNKLFIGRANALTNIQEALENSSIVIVAGQGGFGKTQTAIEYAYIHAYDYHCIWCFNAESETRLTDDYRYFAEKIGLYTELANDFSHAKEYITDWFKSKKCLFIYDNAENFQNLGKHLPQGHSSSHMLINSRERVQGVVGKNFDIEVFSPGDAITFVKKHITNVSDSEAEKLSNILGYLPLALEQAVSYINNNDLTCAQYLTLFSDERNRMRLLKSPSTDTEYKKTVATTWNITLDKLEKDAQSDQLSRAAVQLLKLCAYCAPDDIPLRMFIDGRGQLPPPLREMLDTEDKLSHIDLIGKLKDYSIISMQRNNNGEALLTIHRLIQEVINDNLQDTQWLSYCLDMATIVFDYEYDNKQSFDQFSATLPHMLEIARHTDTTFRNDGNKQEKVAKLYHEAGFGVVETGNYAKALEWYEKASAIREKVLGKEHLYTASSYNNIAVVCSYQGDYAKALEWHEKALAIREKVLGKEHPYTAVTYSNIAGVCFHQGDYAEALELYQKALTINEKVLGKKHSETAATYNDIAVVYDKQGDYAKALELYQKALAIKEKMLGKQHPDTIAIRNNIAGVFDSQGDYAKALKLYQKTLAIKENVLDKEHPDTIVISNNIAGVYFRQGDYAKALEWYKKALAISEKVLGTEHPYIATTCNNIANVYYNQGDYVKAMEWYMKDLAISEKVLGTDHPYTAITYNNIAGVYLDQGDYAKALKWYKKALDISEKVLGAEHPDTATTYNNIAGVYQDQGDYAKALEWYEKALAIREKVLGKKHPYTATTYNNIALVYHYQGDYAKALEWYKKDLAISEKALGAEHPDTATTYNNIAGVYYDQGDNAKALKWYRKALDISEKVLGTEHPDTATTYNNIALVYSYQGDYAKALELYEKALVIREKVLGKEHPDTVVTRDNIAEVYKTRR